MLLTPGTVPPGLEDKGIPQAYLDKFIEVHNKFLEAGDDEAAAWSKAMLVLVRELRAHGYRQNTAGVWVKSSIKEEAARPETALMLNAQLGGLTVCEGQTLASALAEGLRFEMVLLIDHAVSQQGTGCERYYSPAFVDKCLARTQERMAQGHVLTIYNSHAAALGDMWSMGPSANPLGKLESLERRGDRVLGTGLLAPTSEGQDLIKLIYAGIRQPTSVRIGECRAVERRVQPDGKEGADYGWIVEMQDGVLYGVDFCDEAGIPGAGILDIRESAPVWAAEERKDNDMEWQDITLEDLTRERADLLEPLFEKLRAAEAQLAEQAPQLTEARAKVAEIEAQLAELETVRGQVAEAQSKLAEAQTALALERAAQGWLGQVVVAKLAAEQVPAEQLAERAQALRAEALLEVASPAERPGQGTIESKLSDKENPSPEEALQEALDKTQGETIAPKEDVDRIIELSRRRTR
jgi:hypothetical protein